MKMPKEVYAKMKAFLLPAMNKETFSFVADFPEAQERYRWDCLWETAPNGFVRDLYSLHGLSDTHIDTALRSLVKELT